MTQRVRMKRWKALCCHVSTAADTQQLTQTFKARRFSTCAWSCITVLVGRRVRLSGPEEQGRLTRLRRESIIDEDEACLEHIDLARGALHLQLMRAHYITEQQGGRRRKSFGVVSEKHPTQSLSEQRDAISWDMPCLTISVFITVYIFKDTRRIWWRFLSQHQIASASLKWK